MATTIWQGFEGLRQNVEITGLQVSTVSTRQQNVRDAVARGLDVLDSFLTGSYRRSTMIAPLSGADVDVFVVLDPKYYEATGQAALLDRVRTVLRKTYPRTPRVSRNGQAVTITFTDFQVDVVPAFYRRGGGFLIPDSVGKRWIETDPRQHITLWERENARHNKQLVPLMKMMKAWNVTHSQLLQSFHLESLVLQVLGNVMISDFPSGVRYVFDGARSRFQSVPDPAGYGGNTAAYLNTATKLFAVKSRMEQAYQRARAAENLAGMNLLPAAFAKWRVTFGDYFPAYG